MGMMKDMLIEVVTHVYGGDDGRCDALQTKIMEGDPVTAEELALIGEIESGQYLIKTGQIHGPEGAKNDEPKRNGQ